MPELARQAFKAIAEFTYDWESWIGPEGTTRWVNPAVERITGWTPSECIEMADYPLALVHLDDRETIGTALLSAASGSSGNDLEFRAVRRDGDVRWCAISWQPLTSEQGKRLGYRTSVRDMSERKRMEQRLRTALARAEASDRARAAFLAGISHELRTPIHNILGYADLLARSELPAKPLHWLDIIRDQGQALLGIIEDLLDLSAHDAKRSPRCTDPYDPTELIRRTTEAHRARLQDKGLKLELRLGALPERIVGDARGVAQILRNLIDNARKFTTAGQVTVEANLLAAPAGTQLVLSVTDTGMGMPPDQVNELRRPFVRGDASRQRDQEGVGLGLAIVDRLVTQGGGELEIETAVDRGSRFTVRLPSAEEQRVDAKAVDRPTETLPRMVLVVDDQPVSRELAQEFLSRLGCQWRSAGSAEEALERCQEDQFEVVLMDLHMPRIDGAQAAQLLRAQLHPGGRMPRILAMTADVFTTDLARFDGFLPKPVRLETLRRCLSEQSDTVAQDRRHLGSDTRVKEVAAVLLDHDRLAELRGTKTADGSSFFDRFGKPALSELHELAEQLDTRLTDSARAAQTALFHRIKNGALLLGAQALAQGASMLQSRLEDGAHVQPADVRRLEETMRQTLHALEAECQA